MAELGETSDPKQLVEGEPHEIRASSGNLVRFGDWFIEIGDGFKRLDAGGWEGEAGDAFRQRYEREPRRWLKAGDAFHDAAKAMNDYSDTLEWGQSKAREAIEIYEAGRRATERARDEHERAPAGMPFDDPGEAQRQEARDVLQRAREQVDEVGHRAASAVRTAQQDAPEKPTLLDDIGAALSSAAEVVGDIPGNWAHYVLDGVGNAVDATGTAAAGIVDGAGNVAGGAFDLVGLDGRAVEQSTEASSNAIFDDTNRTADDVREGADGLASALGTEDPPPYGENAPDVSRQPVIVKSEKYPESAEHISDAQDGFITRGDPSTMQEGKPLPPEVTIDKPNADINRREALRGITARGGESLDRDEYPPAMFKEGGEGSSVRYIDRSDNRGSGASMNAQIRAQGLGHDNPHVRIMVE